MREFLLVYPSWIMSFYTMLRKYSKRMRGLHLLSVSSFYILGALLKKKQLFHSLAIYNLKSNESWWNNC